MRAGARLKDIDDRDNSQGNAILTGSQGLARLDPAPEAFGAGAPARLAVTRLTLTDFRCYARERLEADPRPVVLTGPNGAGKTNLLEAISFLVPGRGLRRARLADIARRDGGGTWGVAARLDGALGTVEVGTGREAAAETIRERRAVRIDGEAAKGQAALGAVASAVWLTPRMDRLFSDGGGARRRFLDRLVFASDPAHAGRVSAYDHALRERARLLRGGGADASWLSALEETMAEKGVAVTAARNDMAIRLDAISATAAGPFPGARARLVGAVETWLAEMPALAVEDRLRETLAASRASDAESGGAAVGPQRSDLDVVHTGKDVAAGDCSTGEQKALLIALILAHARLLADERGTLPLLLLDEVVAHLDAERREALFGRILELDVQAWLTGTDADLFASLGPRAQRFRVEDAAVRTAD
jgi:DNA replication and repair protein RecF